MITFNTIVPLPDTARLDEVANLAREWVAGSPHTALADQLLDPALDDRTDWSVSDTDEYAEALQMVGDGYARYGLRYIKDESSGVRWVSDVLYAEDDSGRWVAVTVSCDSESTALRLPMAKKPYILRLLIERVGGGEDGELVVSDKPYGLSGSEIAFAADMLTGNARNSLPIVYLSASANGDPALDPKRLARWLSGVAHVVSEPNREFSYRLAIEVNHQNPYGGAVGIYWPDDARSTRLLPREHGYDPNTISKEIGRLLRDRSVRLRIPRRLTWTHLLENRARREIERLREAGSEDLDQYVANFDNEVKAKEEALEAAEKEIARLKAEVHGLKAKTRSSDGSPLLVWGEETDLYGSENLAIVVDALESALSQAPEGSRRHHVLSALLAANPVEKVAPQYSETIKHLLSQYRTMDSEVSGGLEEMGFEISSSGKHHKLVFRGDRRYQFSMPKTSSDHRGGMNMATEINRKLF